MRSSLLDRLNPVVKAVTILICGLLLAFSGSAAVNLATAVVCFLTLIFLSKVRLSAILRLLVPALLLAAALFFTGLFFGGNGGQSDMLFSPDSLSAAVLLSSRILGYVGLGSLFALSTDGEQFITALMLQGGIKPKFAYGILAAYHLLPAITREYQQAKLACQVRGVGIAPHKPVFNGLVNCIRWSETVAMAMESKGFDGDAPRTCQAPTAVHPCDFIFAVITLLAMGGATLCARLLA